MTATRTAQGHHLPQESCLDCLDFSSKLPRLTDNAKEVIADLLESPEIHSCLMVTSAVYTRMSTQTWLLVIRWQLETNTCLFSLDVSLARIHCDVSDLMGERYKCCPRTRILRLKKMLLYLEDARKQLEDFRDSYARLRADVPNICGRQRMLIAHVSHNGQVVSKRMNGIAQLVHEYVRARIV